MSQIRIYIEPKDVSDLLIVKDKEIIHKLKNVLRLKVEDSLYIFDGKGREFLYTINDISAKKFTLEKKSLVKTEPACKKHLTLAFPLAKEEKIDFILQKATELGVSAFIPFTCERSLDFTVSGGKIERWKKIIIEAARQSRRLWLPSLDELTSFSSLLESNYPIQLVLSIKGKKLDLVLNKESNRIIFLVGPEGDFSPREIKRLEDKDFQSLKLSSNTLRLETAAAFAAGLINHYFYES